MRVIIIILICSCSFVSGLNAQLEAGIALLKSERYHEATTELAKVIAKDPHNITAQICYGRALGLSGEKKAARAHFIDLASNEPNHIDVQLNLGEAYMWNQQYTEAQTTYWDILQVDSLNFVALFGYANAFAAMKQPVKAADWMYKAYALDPQNTQVINSLKFILLERSAYEKKTLDFNQALRTINTVLELIPNDLMALHAKAECLLVMKKYKKALRIYETLNKQDFRKTQITAAISYLYFVMKKYDLAHVYNAKHKTLLSPGDSLSLFNNGLHRANILAASRQYDNAFRLLDSLQNTLDYDHEVSQARARFLVWKGEVQAGKTRYDSLPNLQAAYMIEVADLNRAQSNNLEALHILEEAQKTYPSNPDIDYLIKTLEKVSKQSIKATYTSTGDMGGNKALEMSATYLKPMRKAQTLQFGIGQRKVMDVRNFQAKQSTFTAGYKRQVHAKLGFQSTFGIMQAEAQTSTTNIVGNFEMSYKLNNTHSFAYKFDLNYQNYSADLVARNMDVKSHSFTYNGSYGTRLGLYLNMQKQILGDGNHMHMAFASLYYHLGFFPIVKCGFNAQTMGFQAQKPETYFSPAQFFQAEAFLSISNMDKNKTFGYALDYAVGQQVFDAAELSITHRLSIEGAYNFKKGKISAKYFYTSASAGQVLNYDFNSISLNAQYFF